MFEQAIETASKFTRPICTISRFYGSNQPVAGTATLFLINEEGWALTCAHVAQVLISANEINAGFERFRNEKKALTDAKNYRKQLGLLETRYGYNSATTVQILTNFINCVDKLTDFTVHLHPEVDAALIKLNGFSRIYCDEWPVFARSGAELKQGKFLCRLGFPFPEFKNFQFNAAADSIEWNNEMAAITPQFPIEGMVTRHLLGPSGRMMGFETSTPGLKGQSGGPAFDTEGRVWGMQSATHHLDLDFDVDIEVPRFGRKKRVTNNPFLHVGNCIHIDVLREFMTATGVKFSEG